MKKIPMLERFAAQSLVEYDGELVFSKEKFAELIVRECAELCLEHETMIGPFDTTEFRKGRHFNTMIKAHFGVEE